MKVRITRQDNDEALDQAFRELDELMDGRLVNGRKERHAPKPAAAEAAPVEEEQTKEEPEFSEDELAAAMARLGE